MTDRSTTNSETIEWAWQKPGLVRRAERIVHSYRHFTGRNLLDAGLTGIDLARALHEAPVVVVSHGTETDPVLNYGNATALRLWGMTWQEFTSTPSRFTAEAPNRDERARLLAAVTARGHIDDYSGVRISRDGRRFRITQATVWNLLTEAGEPCGQAATFSRWEWLPGSTT